MSLKKALVKSSPRRMFKKGMSRTTMSIPLFFVRIRPYPRQASPGWACFGTFCPEVWAAWAYREQPYPPWAEGLCRAWRPSPFPWAASSTAEAGASAGGAASRMFFLSSAVCKPPFRGMKKASPQTGRVEVTSLHGFIYENATRCPVGRRCSCHFEILE